MQTKTPYKLTLKEYQSLFNKLYEPLCLFANSYLSNLELSKDIVQDLFVKIWEDKIEFKTNTGLKSYLYTSIKNRSLDHLKSKRYKSTIKLSSIKIETLETESHFLREVMVVETSQVIDKAINTLPNKCAQIIRLSVKKLTNSQIANELGISINTVKAQKKIAYKRLKPLLKDYFVLISFIFDS